MILVEHDADGEVNVSQTGDHLGRKGAGLGRRRRACSSAWSAPPLLARGRRRRRGRRASSASSPSTRSRAASRAGLGEKLKPGTAAIIAIVDDEDRLAAEQALPGTPAKSVAAMDKKGVRGAQGRPGRGGAASSSPTAPCCRSPTRPSAAPPAARIDELGRPTGSIDPRAEGPRGRAQRAARPHRRRRLRRPDTFGGRIRTPEPAPACSRWASPTTASTSPRVCSPTRAALLTGRNHHRVGFGAIAEFPGPVPRLHRRAPAELHRAAAHPARRTATSPAASASGT